MGRPRLADIDTATTERILAAAEDSFARSGFEAARLEDIAAAAGVRRPSLLYHFPSKDKLYAATVARVFTQLRDSLVRSMTAEGSFLERVEATVRNYIAFLAEHPNLSRIFVREILDAGGPGEALIHEQVAPLLDLAEAFVRETGKGFIREGIDVRGAILQVVGGAVLYAISEKLRAPLWDGTRPLHGKDAASRRDARFIAGMLQLIGGIVLEEKAFAAAVRRAEQRAATSKKTKRKSK